MAGVAKCLGIIASGSFVGAAGASYFIQSKMNKAVVKEAQNHAKDGKIPVGGMTKDGKLWDGAMTVDEFKKELNKRTTITSLIKGAGIALFTTLVSGITLLLKAKIK